MLLLKDSLGTVNTYFQSQLALLCPSEEQVSKEEPGQRTEQVGGATCYLHFQPPVLGVPRIYRLTLRNDNVQDINCQYRLLVAKSEEYFCPDNMHYH